MKRFSFSVNMKALQTARVGIVYEEFLEQQLGRERYTLPLAGLDMDIIEEFRLEIELRSTRGITHRLVEGMYEALTNIEDHSTTHTSFSFVERDFHPDEDFSLEYKEETLPLNGTMLVHYDDVAGEYYFFNLFSPQKSELGGAMSKDIIFVLDKSGSMGGMKIDQLQQAFTTIVGQLPEDDRFAIITFDSAIHVYRSELIHATEENRKDARDHINGIEADGSTNIYDGLEKALSFLEVSQGRVPIIVMLTDGLPYSGTYSAPLAIRDHIRERNTIDCPIFCLGFGEDVNMDFLSALSLENYAVAKKIYAENDAGEQITDFYETISTTLLRDIGFSYSEGTTEVYPTNAPSLFEGSELIVTGRCEGRLETISSTITAYTRDGKREFRENYELNGNEENTSFIKRFWAYSKIYALMDRILVEGEDEALVSEIEALSMDAHFVTPYTSLYLEIDEEEQGPDDGGDGGDDRDDDHQQTGNSSAVNYGPYRSSDPDPGYANSGGGGGSQSLADEGGSGSFLPGFELLAVACSIGVVVMLRKQRGKK